MTRATTIGIVDYGVGNHASVARAFTALGYRCRVSRDTNLLRNCDALVLPGVGAFPVAMAALQAHRLDDFVRQQAAHAQPIIGLCLGMQLLADESLEHGTTAGLGLIPGRVVPLQGARWHIGWNSIRVTGQQSLLQPSDGAAVYFNHGYTFQALGEFQACTSRLGETLVAGVARGNVVGLQFHPEKSQSAGRLLLRNVVEGLLHA